MTIEPLLYISYTYLGRVISQSTESIAHTEPERGFEPRSARYKVTALPFELSSIDSPSRIWSTDRQNVPSTEWDNSAQMIQATTAGLFKPLWCVKNKIKIEGFWKKKLKV